MNLSIYKEPFLLMITIMRSGCLPDDKEYRRSYIYYIYTKICPIGSHPNTGTPPKGATKIQYLWVRSLFFMLAEGQGGRF